ncbi:hypothetical protein F5X96DRAFT_496615 [Biscogniauxia mediterranea]|nr:hypothetical protein F5X96DRAFT_496615 [Biscogniauxia mediterranea]
MAEESRIPLEVWRQETDPAFWDMAVELPFNLRKASRVHLTTHFAQVVQDVNLNLDEGRSLRRSVLDGIGDEGIAEWTTHEFKRVHRAFREELVRLFNERGAGHLDLAL